MPEIEPLTGAEIQKLRDFLENRKRVKAAVITAVTGIICAALWAYFGG